MPLLVLAAKNAKIAKLVTYSMRSLRSLRETKKEEKFLHILKEGYWVTRGASLTEDHHRPARVAEDEPRTVG